MDISKVSRTAILTLVARVATYKKDGALINDPMGALCLERLTALASDEEKRWIERENRIYGGLQANHARAGAKRALAYDAIADRYIAENPGCTVINLGCGFDTRFWRLRQKNCRYIEIDLPEVISIKKDALGEKIGYEMIGCSVLDASWMDRVTENKKRRFLFIAEGLFSYIPEPEVKKWMAEIARRFECSRLALDIVPESYTKGLWKRILRLESRITWGLDVSWVYGIRQSRDLERFAPGLKVLSEEKGSAGPIITVSINES